MYFLHRVNVIAKGVRIQAKHGSRIDTANEVGKNMVSTILTAAAAGKQVGFGINGCMHNSPQVYRVEVIF